MALDLENLQSVGGKLDLHWSKIRSLGNLQSVGGELNLISTKINSLGKLNFVGKNLYLQRTPLSKMYTREQIREIVNVGGKIFL